MKEDKIPLSDLIFNNFKFENLVSIFNLEQAEIYTQAINNAIISKVYKELKLISEDKILITDGRTIVYFYKFNKIKFYFSSFIIIELKINRPNQFM